MSDFLFHPVTHEAAREFIQNKPVVARSVFNRMLPEIKGRAFTITGVEDANVMQRVLDKIAELPEGAVWDNVKRDIADELSKTDPFVPNPDADAKEIDAAMKAAEARAELLMRTHGFQAYESLNHQAIAANADVFPYSMYVTAGDERVRNSHAALNGVCLPTDDPFWQTHTPPWEWGCRCTKVGKTAEEIGEIRGEDAGRLPEERQLIEGAAKRKLDENGTLFRSVNGAVAQNYDVRPPVERATTDAERRAAYQWNPDTLRLSLDQLKARYDVPAWDVFEQFARSQKLDAGKTVWEWLGGSPILPPESPVVPPSAAPPLTFDGALALVGLDKSVMWTGADIRRLLAEIAEEAPEKITDKVVSITGAGLKTKGPLSEAALMKSMQGMLDLIPRSVTGALPKFSVVVERSMGNTLGSYDPATQTLRLNHALLSKKPLAKQRETIYHEMAHWVHLEGPQWYRDAIREHYAARTTGEKSVPSALYSNCRVKRDKWFDEYAGREYDNEHGKPSGIEVPTRYIQLAANPDRLVQQMDPTVNAHAAHFAETMRVAWSIFFEHQA